jgi:type II secretory pathway component HofQ
MKKEIGLLLTLALAGALSAEPAPDRAHPEKAERRRSHAQPPEAKPEVQPSDDLISLDLKDADLRDVLRTIASLERINIAIDPEVRGSVTIRLNDVRWDQALDVILRSNGLGCVIKGNVLRVGTPAHLADP